MHCGAGEMQIPRRELISTATVKYFPEMYLASPAPGALLGTSHRPPPTNSTALSDTDRRNCLRPLSPLGQLEPCTHPSRELLFNIILPHTTVLQNYLSRYFRNPKSHVTCPAAPSPPGPIISFLPLAFIWVTKFDTRKNSFSVKAELPALVRAHQFQEPRTL
jgi:hypothetical protein